MYNLKGEQGQESKEAHITAGLAQAHKLEQAWQ
jgi:hypothetical protein